MLACFVCKLALELSGWVDDWVFLRVVTVIYAKIILIYCIEMLSFGLCLCIRLAVFGCCFDFLFATTCESSFVISTRQQQRRIFYSVHLHGKYKAKVVGVHVCAQLK